MSNANRIYERDDPVGDELIFALLAEIEEDERLSELIGVDIRPPNPDPAHAPTIIPNLEEWLHRTEEVHQFLHAARKREREGFGHGR